MSEKKGADQFEIAHNLNNLLGIIVSRAQLIQRKKPSLKYKSDLVMIEKAAEAASQMAHRLQSEKAFRTPLQKEWINLNELLSDVVEMTRSVWQYQSQKKGTPIHVAMQFRTLPKAYVSAFQLKEVFINFILNAVDALSEKGGMIEIETLREKEWIKIIISDSGKGMSEHTLQNLYEPYFSTKGEAGSGLGLSSSKKIIEAHEGKLQVQSRLKEGTKFTILLPVQEIKQKSLVRRILIVDDEKDYRTSTAELLVMEGYHVEQANDAQEALEKIRYEKFDVILLDMNMPCRAGLTGVSGKELASFIKAKDLKTKVILISGKSMQEMSKSIVDKNIDGWLVKPCLVEDIQRMIQ